MTHHVGQGPGTSVDVAHKQEGAREPGKSRGPARHNIPNEISPEDEDAERKKKKKKGTWECCWSPPIPAVLPGEAGEPRWTSAIWKTATPHHGSPSSSWLMAGAVYQFCRFSRACVSIINHQIIYAGQKIINHDKFSANHQTLTLEIMWERWTSTLKGQTGKKETGRETLSCWDFTTCFST